MAYQGATVERPPLDAANLRRRVIQPGGLWREIRVVAETGSTNADLLAEARAGAAEGLVLAAETQTAGRGRLGRSWVSPPRAALTFSVLLRPAAVRPGQRGWLPLLTGVAVAAALRAEAAVPAVLKWPNDVLIGERKLAGILAEAHGDAIVVGVGLNVTSGPGELPVPTATSLRLEGATPGREALASGRDTPPGHGDTLPGCGHAPADYGDAPAGTPGREALLEAILAGLAGRYQAWCAAPDAPGWREDYLRWCATVGRPVRAELPGGRQVSGTAVDVDAAGRLIVQTGDGLVPVGAGDVVHVR